MSESVVVCLPRGVTTTILVGTPSACCMESIKKRDFAGEISTTSLKEQIQIRNIIANERK